MKTKNKIIIFFLLFISLSTFSPKILTNIDDSIDSFFKIKKINFIDRSNSTFYDDKFKKKLNYFIGKNIFFVNQDQFKDYINPIVISHNFTIKKKFPNEIIFIVDQLDILGLLVKKNKKFFLLKDSQLLEAKENFHDDYPNIFGLGAEQKFEEFYKKLLELNFPTKLIKNYFYFKANRWDLNLINGQTFKLPSNNVNKSIKQINLILQNDKFKDYSIIDLRLDDKIITSK